MILPFFNSMKNYIKFFWMYFSIVMIMKNVFHFLYVESVVVFKHSETCPDWTSLEPTFVFAIQVYYLYTLNFQRFPTLWPYLKFGIYRIPFYSGFRLDTFYCISVVFRNIISSVAVLMMSTGPPARDQ
jgi:hypothetical protein